MNSNLHHVIELTENHWQNARVLVVGDVMLDKYVWGSVERISPEAPVPIVLSARLSNRPGGAANVGMNLVGLGAHATVVGFVGNDEDANTLHFLLIDGGVNPLLVPVQGFPTTSKLRILSDSHQMLRLDFEKKESRPEAAYEELIRQAREEMAACAAVILSDYAKGALNERVCQTIIDDARTLGIPVLVDPKSLSFEKYRNATAVCPNLRELSLAAGTSSDDFSKLLDIAEAFVEKYGFDFLTVTLGPEGIMVLKKNLRLHAPAQAKQVFDVSGAGDTVIATLALALACELEIESAMELANVAAGIVVSKAGTTPIGRSELISAISVDIALQAEEKILNRERLLARVATWRAAGDRIVFTNGCFDLLHAGHIHLIERAHQQGDRVVVAINSDESVRNLKGPSRPVVGELERARVLAALAATDAVLIFNDVDPLELILALRPDVLVKGSDYHHDTVVGAHEVRSWGGRVCLVPLADGYSTTRLVSKVTEQAFSTL
ncbi:MAG: D-glycero-beta-D-manno-heptose 1-phosphate adenylyltransferase [Terracidiphilus sp.]